MAMDAYPIDELDFHLEAAQRVVFAEELEVVARRQHQVGCDDERQRHRVLRHVVCARHPTRSVIVLANTSAPTNLCCLPDDLVSEALRECRYYFTGTSSL